MTWKPTDRMSAEDCEAAELLLQAARAMIAAMHGAYERAETSLEHDNVTWRVRAQAKDCRAVAIAMDGLCQPVPAEAAQ